MIDEFFLETLKLKKLEPYVLQVLEENEQSRKDDFLLYGLVLKELGVSLNIRLKEFFVVAKQIKAPPFESVSRIRRHIQELRPDLKDSKVAIKRQEQEEVFENYNKSSIGE